MASPETPSVAPVAEAAPAVAPALPATAGPRLYELSQPTLFNPHELRRLKSDYDTIRRSCAARLALLFRTEFDFKLTALTTPTYRQLVSQLSTPTQVTLFKIESLRGIGLLEISPALALVLLDRLMGGQGAANQPTRDLTEIETSLLGQVTHLITEAWCTHWSGWKPLKSALIGNENDPRYLQTAPPDSSMLVATFDAQIGEASGQIRFALPFTTIDPLLQKIRAELQPPTEAPANTPAPAPKPTAWNPALDHVNIPASAELPGPTISARQLQALKVGDVLPLPTNAADLIQLKLSGVPRFQARLGLRDEHWAVEVLNALKS